MDGDEDKDDKTVNTGSHNMFKLVDYDTSATSGTSEVFSEEILQELTSQPIPQATTYTAEVSEQAETVYYNTKEASTSEIIVSVPLQVSDKNMMVRMNLVNFANLPAEMFTASAPLSPCATSTGVDFNAIEVEKQDNSGDIAASKTNKENVDPEPAPPSQQPVQLLVIQESATDTSQMSVQQKDGKPKTPRKGRKPRKLTSTPPTTTRQFASPRCTNTVSREFRVPTQVGVSDDGSLVTDFPFDNPKYSPQEKKVMSVSTRKALQSRNRLTLKKKQKSNALQLAGLESNKYGSWGLRSSYDRCDDDNTSQVSSLHSSVDTLDSSVEQPPETTTSDTEQTDVDVLANLVLINSQNEQYVQQNKSEESESDRVIVINSTTEEENSAFVDVVNCTMDEEQSDNYKCDLRCSESDFSENETCQSSASTQNPENGNANYYDNLTDEGQKEEDQDSDGESAHSETSESVSSDSDDMEDQHVQEGGESQVACSASDGTSVDQINVLSSDITAETSTSNTLPSLPSIHSSPPPSQPLPLTSGSASMDSQNIPNSSDSVAKINDEDDDKTPPMSSEPEFSESGSDGELVPYSSEITASQLSGGVEQSSELISEDAKDDKSVMCAGGDIDGSMHVDVSTNRQVSDSTSHETDMKQGDMDITDTKDVEASPKSSSENKSESIVVETVNADHDYAQQSVDSNVSDSKSEVHADNTSEKSDSNKSPEHAVEETIAESTELASDEIVDENKYETASVASESIHQDVEVEEVIVNDELVSSKDIDRNESEPVASSNTSYVTSTEVNNNTQIINNDSTEKENEVVVNGSESITQTLGTVFGDNITAFVDANKAKPIFDVSGNDDEEPKPLASQNIEESTESLPKLRNGANVQTAVEDDSEEEVRSDNRNPDYNIFKFGDSRSITSMKQHYSDESDEEYEIAERFQTLIDRPLQQYRLIELRDLMGHLGRHWKSNKKSKLSMFVAILRQIQCPATFKEGNLRTMVLAYIQKFLDDVKKLIAPNLQQRNMTVFDLINKIKTKQWDGAEMTLMIISQMWTVPIAVYHPEYIWVSHCDKSIIDCPIILLFDGSCTWHPTFPNGGALLRLNDRIDFSAFADTEEKKKTFKFSRKRHADNSASDIESTKTVKTEVEDTTAEKQDEKIPRNKSNPGKPSEVKTKAQLKERLQAKKESVSKSRKPKNSSKKETERKDYPLRSGGAHHSKVNVKQEPLSQPNSDSGGKTPPRQTRSSTSKQTKRDESNPSKGRKQETSKSSKGSKKTAEMPPPKKRRTDSADWVDPNVFDLKRVKHKKKEVYPEVDDQKDGTIFCSKCNKTFDDVPELKEHEKSCYKGRRYPCFFKGCTKSFSQRSQMHQHFKGVHQNNPYRCPHCKAPYIFLKVMKYHIKTEHERDQATFKYDCDQCTFGTDNKSQFQIHRDRHNDVKRYQCGNCGYKTFSQSQLTLHMNSCIEGISFECDECGKTFQQKSYLKRHFRTEHVEGKEVFFDDKCIKIFKYKKNFEKHMSKEHNVKVNVKK